MINLNIYSCANAEFISELNSLIKSFEFDLKGEITLNLTDIKQSEEDIVQKWELYRRKSERKAEYQYISEWSPNNGSEIGKLRKNNEIIKELTSYWYQNANKYESIDMIDYFDDYCYEKFDLSVKDILELYKENKDLPDSDYHQISEDEKAIFKKDFFETLDVFYSRNPKFRNDW